MKTYEEDRSTSLLVEETKKYKILGRDAERKLFEEYSQTTDFRRKQEIKVAIIQSNLRFVLAVARAYKRQNGLPINDFYAEGKLGLLEAFEKYDYRGGTKFGSFAVFEVRRHMDMIVNNSDIVRVPVMKRHRILDARKKGMRVDKIKYGVLADNAVREATSFSALLNDHGDSGDSGTTVGDTIASDAETDRNHGAAMLRESLRNVMEDNLTPEENNLLRRLYALDGVEYSVSEISAEQRISKEMVRRLRSKALAKLRGLNEVTELRTACGG